jgi:hypothetical protein
MPEHHAFLLNRMRGYPLPQLENRSPPATPNDYPHRSPLNLP